MKKSKRIILSMISLSSFFIAPVILSSCETKNKKIADLLNNENENTSYHLKKNKDEDIKIKETTINKSPIKEQTNTSSNSRKNNEIDSNNIPKTKENETPLKINNHSNTYSSPKTKNELEKPNIVSSEKSTNELNKIEEKIESNSTKIEIKDEETFKIHMSDEEINNFYPIQNVSSLQPTSLSFDQVKDRIINQMYASNYYEHPNFILENKTVSLNKKIEDNEKIQLKLLDTKTKKAIENVRWFQRIRYPHDLILEEDKDSSQALIKLSKNGIIEKKKTPEANKNDVVEVWAEHQGYLYRTMVKIGGEDTIRETYEQQQARNKAKEIVKDWMHLPLLQKIIKAHDWIIENIQYHDTKDIWKDQSAYSALVDLKAICTGYAKAFKMLMDELGIPSSIITGSMDQSLYPNYHTRHAWNLVELDGEWYHVDTTTDHIIYQTNKRKKNNKISHKFFLMHDKDFGKGNSYFNYFEKRMGQRFRNFKHLEDGSFVRNKEEAFAQFERLYGVQDNEQLPKWLDLYGDEKLFEEIKNEFETKGFKPKQAIIVRANDDKTWKMGYRKFRFEFDNEDLKNKSNKEQINFKVEKHAELVLKVIIENKKINDFKLNSSNFIVNKGKINEIKDFESGYLVYLDHFEDFGKNDIKLDIQKFGYKFNSNSNLIQLNVNKHQTPSANLKTIGSNRAILSGVTSGMEYRNNSEEWKEITHDHFEISNLVSGSVSIRYKSNENQLQSDIQKIEMPMADDIDKQIKVYDNKIIGVDSMMEYRLKDTQKWIEIKSNQIDGLKKGTYQFRTKAHNKTLASQIYEILIN
ncbi:MAG6410 family transglutaminase-related lipoprotein [Metamycoplasma auris]|uniref:Transglutaminase superfamily protein n=1 Tax=Metamycoplasma auris TaxID=51363 RepID=A0A2W7G5H3_9BACT|nr:transglutaminase domain-containing protein [Metamycoplasma auris]PZW01517.1 transglutaminase superfamily protein [Metamycoplasma auris]